MTGDDVPPAQNRLEEALEGAAGGDAAAIEAFPAALLEGELYVAGDEATGGLATARLGEEAVVAAFTSPARIEAATGSSYVRLPARAVLEQRPRGLAVVLNPGVWHGKELLPGEIDRLLGGVVTVPAGAKVMLGLPAERPVALLAGLAEWLPTRPDVLSARLGQIYDEGSGEPPHPLVGLELADGARMEDVFASRPAFADPFDLVPLAEHPLGAWLRENGEEIYRRDSV